MSESENQEIKPNNGHAEPIAKTLSAMRSDDAQSSRTDHTTRGSKSMSGDPSHIGDVSQTVSYRTIHKSENSPTSLPETITKPKKTADVSVPTVVSETNSSLYTSPVRSISLQGCPIQRPLTFKLKDKLYIIYPGANQTTASAGAMLNIPTEAKRPTKDVPIIVPLQMPKKSVKAITGQIDPASQIRSSTSPRSSEIGPTSAPLIPEVNEQRTEDLSAALNDSAMTAIKQEVPDMDESKYFYENTIGESLITPVIPPSVPQTESDPSFYHNMDYEHCGNDDGLVKLCFARNHFPIASTEPVTRYLVVTLVTDSSHHPLHGYCLDSTDVTVTYDSQGRMRIIQAPYIQIGALFEVIPDGVNRPHPDFPNGYKQNAKLIRRLRVDNTALGSQYIELESTCQLCPVPADVFTFLPYDCLGRMFYEFVHQPDFQTYTLPILLGHGQKDIWSGRLGLSETKPAFVRGQVDKHGWDWPIDNGISTYRRLMAEHRDANHHMRQINTMLKQHITDDISDTDSAVDSNGQEDQSGVDMMKAESEQPQPKRRHNRDCRCDSCMDPQELEALLNQIKPRKPFPCPNTRTRKRKRARSKSCARVKRSKCSEEKSSSTEQMTSSENCSPTYSAGFDSDDTASLPSSPSDSPATPPSPASRRRSPSRRVRKRKAACECPDCSFVKPLPKKVCFAGPCVVP